MAVLVAQFIYYAPSGLIKHEFHANSGCTGGYSNQITLWFQNLFLCL